MLITLQSHVEVQAFINDADARHTRRGVLSISPQSLASLCASYYPDPAAPVGMRCLLHRIRAFLGREENGAWTVWDTTFPRHAALREHVREYRERKLQQRQAAQSESPSPPSSCLLPMLASACPGWICYAEKAHGGLLGNVAATRSPQAVAGTLAKKWWATSHGLTSRDVYHVSVMPCYDKKLEASREDFASDGVREVDCVLTTGELALLLEERGFDPHGKVEPQHDVLPDLLDHQGTSSGSYLHALIDAVSAEHSAPVSLDVRRIRNSDDHVEFVLRDASAEGSNRVLFKGAKCYGFRNLQNLVRKLGKDGSDGSAATAPKSKLAAQVAARRKARKQATAGSTGQLAEDDASSPYDYVEVMACPGGCINGGGQVKPTTLEKAEEAMRWSTKEWVAKVEQRYWDGDRDGDDDRKRLADELLERIVVDIARPENGRYADAMDDAAEKRRCDALRTHYRKVESDLTALSSVKW